MVARREQNRLTVGRPDRRCTAAVERLVQLARTPAGKRHGEHMRVFGDAVDRGQGTLRRDARDRLAVGGDDRFHFDAGCFRHLPERAGAGVDRVDVVVQRRIWIGLTV